VAEKWQDLSWMPYPGKKQSWAKRLMSFKVLNVTVGSIPGLEDFT